MRVPRARRRRLIDTRSREPCYPCLDGTVWLTPPPDRDEIKLCAEHEKIVDGVPGWMRADDE